MYRIEASEGGGFYLLYGMADKAQDRHFEDVLPALRVAAINAEGRNEDILLDKNVISALVKNTGG